MRPVCSVTIPRLSGAVAALLLGVLSASAHHNVTGIFDITKEMTVTGKLSKLEWINPHSYIYVDVQDPTGAINTYTFESLPPAMMRRSGVTKEALLGGTSVGETVTIKAHPSKRDAHGGWIIRITYADGHFYQLYSSPDQQ